MTRILAFANQKGGVGKTSLAVHFAAVCAARGQRVLLIDADPQADATFLLKMDDSVADTLEVFLRRSRASPTLPAIPATTLSVSLDLIPAWISMQDVEDWDTRANTPNPSDVAQRVYDAVTAAGYDWVIVDSPPSVSFWFHLVMRLADRVLVPVAVTGPLPLLGLATLKAIVERTRLRYNPRLRLLGTVLNMVDVRKITGRAAIQGQLPGIDASDFVLETVIPDAAALQNAQYQKQTLFEWDPHAKISQAINALVEEVEQRWPVEKTRSPEQLNS